MEADATDRIRAALRANETSSLALALTGVSHISSSETIRLRQENEILRDKLGQIAAQGPDEEPDGEDYDDTESANLKGMEVAWWEAKQMADVGLAEADAVRGQAAPDLRGLLREALDYEKDAFEDDDEVNGGDLVEWFGDWRARVALAVGGG